MKEKTQNLIDEINRMTVKLETEYPELYQHLDELPLTISNGPVSLGDADLINYLESLRE
ncbi:MAG: hypothetical protein OEQ53_11800 [Saprospiraceae bacterium]|nr:hypothetical protein [Saprospiraceae bacterium]